MAIEALRDFVGEWELELPGAEHIRGHVVFEGLGDVLVQRTSIPIPEVPDSVCVVVAQPHEGYVQHYFDSRGVARLYEMTFDGSMWTLERVKADFSALDFCQRYIGTFSGDRAAIDGEWQTSADGRDWQQDFPLRYRRISPSR